MKLKTLGMSAVIVLCAAFAGCGSGDVASVREEFFSPVTETPGVGDPQPGDATFVDRSSAIGFYTDGSIEDPAVLPDESPGLLKIFRLRKRAYATATLVRTLSLAASAWRTEFPVGDRVQVGDITDSNGGSLSGHASHQNGLDVDVAYLKANKVERDPNTNGPSGFAESFVKGGVLTSNFDLPRNWAILRNLVGRGNVGRIFVDPAIKAAFCKKAATLNPSLSAANRNEVLRRLRPYANHTDHFHLRLKCPTGHKKCVAQTEPPTGNGCSDVTGSITAQDDIRTIEQIADDELGDDEG